MTPLPCSNESTHKNATPVRTHARARTVHIPLGRYVTACGIQHYSTMGAEIGLPKDANCPECLEAMTRPVMYDYFAFCCHIGQVNLGGPHDPELNESFETCQNEVCVKVRDRSYMRQVKMMVINKVLALIDNTTYTPPRKHQLKKIRNMHKRGNHAIRFTLPA